MKESGYCELGLEGYVFVLVCLYMCVFEYLHTCGGVHELCAYVYISSEGTVWGHMSSHVCGDVNSVFTNMYAHRALCGLCILLCKHVCICTQVHGCRGSFRDIHE